jgi:hypothetical protein
VFEEYIVDIVEEKNILNYLSTKADIGIHIVRYKDFLQHLEGNKVKYREYWKENDLLEKPMIEKAKFGVNTSKGFQRLVDLEDYKTDAYRIHLIKDGGNYNMYKQKNNYAHNLPVSINDSYSDQLGITDLNSIGHYFFGRDKRILRGNNRNLVISNNDIYNTLLASMSESKIEGKNFYIFHDQHRYKINNIHVHSKIHKKLTNTQYLKYMIRNAVNKNEVIIELNMYHSIKNKLLDCLLDIRSRKSKA